MVPLYADCLLRCASDLDGVMGTRPGGPKFGTMVPGIGTVSYSDMYQSRVSDQYITLPFRFLRHR